LLVGVVALISITIDTVVWMTGGAVSGL